MDAELLPGIVGSIPPGAWMSYGDVARAAGGGDTHARSLNGRFTRTEMAGAHRVLGLDFHQHQLQGFFDIPVDHLYAMPVFTAYFRKKQLKDVAVVAPDVGSAKMARGFAKRLDATLAIIDKRRPKANVSEVMNVVGDFRYVTEGGFRDFADGAVERHHREAEAEHRHREHGQAHQHPPVVR